ANAEVQKQVVD
nr:bnb gene product (amino acids 168-178) [Drosophila melanogaster, Peptide Partial, 11 aa] [Drosophila melanogaster]